MVLINGQPGIQTVADGAAGTGRMDHQGALVVQEANPVLTEITYRGQTFAAAIPPGTGQAHGTAISTTAAFCLANPATSGKNLVLQEINAGYISGTLGAGILALLVHNTAPPITAPSGGTAITPTNMLLGFGTVSVSNCRFNCTVPATGIMIRTLFNMSQIAATAALTVPAVYYLHGGVIIAPGTAVSVQGVAAAGATPLIVVGAVWVEQPV